MSMYDTTSLQNFTETIERYTWTNLPFRLTQDIIERLISKGISLDDLISAIKDM